MINIFIFNEFLPFFNDFYIATLLLPTRHYFYPPDTTFTQNDTSFTQFRHYFYPALLLPDITFPGYIILRNFMLRNFMLQNFMLRNFMLQNSRAFLKNLIFSNKNVTKTLKMKPKNFYIPNCFSILKICA